MDKEKTEWVPFSAALEAAFSKKFVCFINRPDFQSLITLIYCDWGFIIAARMRREKSGD